LEGEGPQPLLLRRRDRLRWVPVGERRTGLHLADDERAALEADEVALALLAPPVASHHGIARLAVPGGSALLPCRPEPEAGRGHSSRSWRGSSSMFTSLNVTTRTDGTKRILVWRYMSHTQASVSSSSTRVRPPS